MALSISSCSKTADSLSVKIDKAHAELSGFWKITLTSKHDYFCVAPWKIQAVQRANDPSIVPTGGGGEEGQFYGALSLAEPLYMIGPKGISFFISPSSKEKNVEIPYVRCEDIITGKKVDQRSVRFTV